MNEQTNVGWLSMIILNNLESRMLENITHLVQFSSVAQSCPTLCNPTGQKSLCVFLYCHIVEAKHTYTHGN